MKTRERLNKIREAKSPLEKLMLASDNDPGTDFDSVFQVMELAWSITHQHDAEAIKSVHSSTFREALQRTNNKRVSRSVTGRRRHELSIGVITHNEPTVKYWENKLYKDLGRDLADGCIRHGSRWLRMMADSLDAWNEHKPDGDGLRSELAWIAHLQNGRVISVRRVKQLLLENGLNAEERIIRRLSSDVGLKIHGKSGRPTEHKP